MDPKHTPSLPLMLANHKQWIVAFNGLKIAQMEAYDGLEADATYIVRAVNAHQELLDALRAMHKRFITESTDTITAEDEIMERMSMEAIAKAEGCA